MTKEQREAALETASKNQTTALIMMLALDQALTDCEKERDELRQLNESLAGACESANQSAKRRGAEVSRLRAALEELRQYGHYVELIDSALAPATAATSTATEEK